MSHFSCYVFSDSNTTAEELLAPYDESLDMPKHIKLTKAQAIRKVREDIENYKNSWYAKYLENPEKYAEEHNPKHLEYISKEFPKRLAWTDDECFTEATKYDDPDMIDENGNIYCCYNDHAQWDYYVLGGGWADTLVRKNGARCSETTTNNIDWSNTRLPFAFIDTEGNWHERAEMGWWGLTINDKPDDTWEKEFRDYVATLDDDVTVGVYDLHI